MKEEVSEIPSWVSVVTNFLSDNIAWLAFIVFIIVFKEALSDFFKRLTGIHYTNGGSKLGLNAEPPSKNEVVQEKDDSQVNDEKYQEVEVSISKDGVTNWFSDVDSALQKDDIESANKIFKEYELNAKDQIQLHKDKSIYFYLLFHDANDRHAIPNLEKHAQHAPTEELRYEALTWLSSCFHKSKQYPRDIELWTKESLEFESLDLVVNSYQNLAQAYRANGDVEQAKKVLLTQLHQVGKGALKASLYSTLALIEEDMGNKVLGSYCRDKSVENYPENLGEVFTSAYNASESGVDELSISNYVLLTDVSPKKSIAWNNLGVQAKESGCKYKSIEFFNKAIELGETLAMANQGYALLDAGFIDEAERIANKALSMEDVHKNVYSLMSRIETVKKEESKKWQDLQRKASTKQAHYRKYTEKHYLGSFEEFDGTWIIEAQEKNISKCSDEITIVWESIAGLSDTKMKFSLKGKVTGATFKGRYKSESIDQTKSSILAGLGGFETECLGYVDGDCIYVFSTEKGSDRTVKLSRKNA
ncbi:tetratricopeptide repeat protein [Vibrio metschnikovii]|nr:tetratricopeptide repeat protein [Vibrio metschnikovii]